jgi:NAD(P)H-hydrate repair Nnr-like enzyme with NAD(P)H-hydrate dehydratase domain
VEDSAVLAAKVNRLAGLYANPTPATQVLDLIKHIPRAIADVLGAEGKTYESRHTG